MSEPLIRETAAPPAQAEAPSTPPTEVTPISPSAPPEIVSAQRILQIVSFLKDKQGLKTAEEIYTACLRYRDASPVLQRATNLEDRIRKYLEMDAPPSARTDGALARSEPPPPAPPPAAEAPTEPTTEIIAAPRQAGVQMIPIGSINLLDYEMRSRAEIDQATIDKYVELMEDGVKFPPIDVFYEDGVEKLHLPDGWHRCHAVIKVRRHQGAMVRESVIDATEIEANVHQGTRRDALLFSFGANGRHGLPTTNADKRRCVMKVLSDEAWGKNSSRWIADQCAVSDRFVGNVKRELAAANGSQVPSVVEGKDGKTYSIANIGKRNLSKSATPPPQPPESPQKSVLSDLKVAATAIQRAARIVKHNCPVLTEKFESQIASIMALQKETHVHEFSQPQPSVSETAETATAHG